MKSLSKVVGALVVCGCAAGVAQAAEPIQLASISGLEGKVMIHKGEGYVLAKEGQALVNGDRVIALRGSKADVAYKSGCVTTLEQNVILAIDNVDVCAKPAKTASQEPLKYAQALGGTDVPLLGGSLLGGGTGTALAGAGLFSAAGLSGTEQLDKKSSGPISGQ